MASIDRPLASSDLVFHYVHLARGGEQRPFPLLCVTVATVVAGPVDRMLLLRLSMDTASNVMVDWLTPLAVTSLKRMYVRRRDSPYPPDTWAKLTWGSVPEAVLQAARRLATRPSLDAYRHLAEQLHLTLESRMAELDIGHFIDY